MKDTSEPMRLLNAVLLLLAGAFVLACITASPVFNGLIALGRMVGALEGLRDVHFEEVISRLLLIYLVVGFYPTIRWAGATSLEPFGMARDLPWMQVACRGWLLGVGSVAALYAVALMTGALVWSPDPWGRVAGRLAGYWVGGVVIALVEEVFFRGALFGLLRRVVHWIPAAIVVSLFFSFVHFLRPAAPGGIVYGEWHTGFALVPHMFFVTDRLDHYVPFAITLFLMSIVLCAMYQRQGHIYLIIGLHAGWVLALQTGKFFVERGAEEWTRFFGTSTNLSRSWSALALLGIMLAVVMALWRRPESS